MKKIITVSLILTFALFGFSQAFTNPSNTLILDSQSKKEKTNYEIISFLYEEELSKTKKWKEYINTINTIIRVFNNDDSILRQIKNNSEKAINSDSKNSLNNDTFNMLVLLNAKVNIKLLDLHVQKENSDEKNKDKEINKIEEDKKEYKEDNKKENNKDETKEKDGDKLEDNKLSKEQIEEVKKYTFMKWVSNTKYSLLEYGEVQCPYCAKLHNEDIYSNLRNPNINYHFLHFPLERHTEAQTAAEILECLWEQRWDTAFFNLLDRAFKDWKYDREYMFNEALRLWAKEKELNYCLENWTFTEKIKNQMELWKKVFNITQVPTAIVINNFTWKFEILVWAYSLKEYEDAMEKLK